MPGEPLMCFWQTASILDKGNLNDQVPKSVLKTILKQLDSKEHINFNSRQFEETFTKPGIAFPAFKQYLNSSDLLDSGLSILVMTCEIESCCWTLVQHKYSSKRLESQQLYQLWAIFNRLSVVGSYPPVVNTHMANYFFQILAKTLKTAGLSAAEIKVEGLTFDAMVTTIEEWLFAKKPRNTHKWLPIPKGLKLFCCLTRANSPSQQLVTQCLDDIHNWLVEEIMKIGWMKIHIRRGANWSTWTKYWFILTPGCLKYYKVPYKDKINESKILKGQIFLDKDTEILDLEENNNKQDRFCFMKNKLKVMDQSQEFELCPENSAEREAWVASLNESVRAIKTGITPQMRLLTERVKLLESDLVIIDQKLEKAQRAARQMLSQSPEEHEEINGGTTIPVSEEQVQPEVEQPAQTDEEQEEEVDALTLQRNKLQAMFLSIDKDGNGKINREEFKAYIDSLGAKVDEKEANLMFDSIDKDKNNFIFFDEFEDFFKISVLGDEDESKSMATLRSAFLQADQDGSGAVSFQEFSEYAYAMRRDLAMEQLMASFHNLDESGDGEISFQEFEKFLQDSTMKEMATKTKPSSNAESFLKNTYKDTDVNELVELLGTRWNKFSNFQRYGDKGELVMKGENEEIKDVIPGSYSLVDLACYNDMPPIEPNKAVIKGVKWHDSTIPGRSGKAVFPSDFDGKIPTDIATNEHLAYYGCSLADRNQTKVSLFYRHGIQDFTYQNNYLSDYVTSENANGGAGIEHHSFSHLDCPMDGDSGVFVLGKYVDEDLHLTGFKVPTRHTLYVPGGVIHSNDYLHGTWRTMLSDEAAINHVHLVKQEEGSGKEDHFVFSFQALM